MISFYDEIKTPLTEKYISYWLIKICGAKSGRHDPAISIFDSFPILFIYFLQIKHHNTHKTKLKTVYSAS